MARQKGMLNLSGNLEPLAGAPLDSRDITPTVADLYIASNWPYKYIGMKTTVTATGDTYRLVNLDVTQESSWVKEGGESGQTIQYDELPAASSSLAGEIYQYTGTTNLQYTNGYFYECVNDGGTYKWVQTNTQPGTSYSDFTGATSQEAGAHGLVPAPTTGDISKFLKGDGTWATVPMPSFDYSSTSPEAMNFSTDEKVIGTWIDGKPLYQKTVNCGALPNNNTIYVPSGLSNVNVKDIFGYAVDASHVQPLNKASTDVSYIGYSFETYYDSFNNTINISTGIDRSGYTGYVTLRYTKTTDTAVASGEKIVGQWIDGKPLYQKTLQYQNITLTADSSYILDDLSGLNIDADECLLVKSFTAKVNESNSIYMQSALSTNKISGQAFLQGTTLNFNSQSNKLFIISSYNTTLKKVSITIQYTKTS